MRRALLLGCLVACGGAPPPPAHELPPPPQPTASATQPPPEAPPTVSVVRYDDLGLSFGVPSDFRVVGDDELAARIRSSASPRLQAELASHANARKGIPLLVLRKDTPDLVEVTLLVSVVPADATAEELMTRQEEALTTAFPDFKFTVTAPETLDAVPGMTLSGSMRGRACRVRIFIRNGVAVFLTAFWPEKSDAAASVAARVLGGLHFTSP